MIYGNTWRNSPSHLTTLILGEGFRFKNSKVGLAFLALPFVYMLSPPSFRESNGSHNAIRGCSRSEVSLTSSCWTCTEKSLGKFPQASKKNKGRNSWNFPRDSLVFYKWDLNMWSFHQWWDNEGLIFEIRVLWSNFLLEWGLDIRPRLLRKHGWYLHPLHCKPQHEKWNWI